MSERWPSAIERGEDAVSATLYAKCGDFGFARSDAGGEQRTFFAHRGNVVDPELWDRADRGDILTGIPELRKKGWRLVDIVITEGAQRGTQASTTHDGGLGHRRYREGRGQLARRARGGQGRTEGGA